MRLRIVSMPASEEQEIQFKDRLRHLGHPSGGIAAEFMDGLVVILPNASSEPEDVIIIDQGEARFFSDGKEFSPRVEDWTDWRGVISAELEVGS